MTKNGLPVGLQAYARRHEDGLLLDLALAMERVRPWPLVAPAAPIYVQSRPVRRFHFSEDPGIRVFEPHVPSHRDGIQPLVWAIDEWHAPMYYTPRQCPRACFWP